MCKRKLVLNKTISFVSINRNLSVNNSGIILDFILDLILGGFIGLFLKGQKRSDTAHIHLKDLQKYN